MKESYKIVPGNPGEAGNVKLIFEWKSPMVWKIKSFIASSPWYAVTVVCTMLLTLAEAVNVSRKIKILFLGGTVTNGQVEIGTPLLRHKKAAGNSVCSEEGIPDQTLMPEEDAMSLTGSLKDSERKRRESYAKMMNTMLA